MSRHDRPPTCCPSCGAPSNALHRRDYNGRTYRRRDCPKCGDRWTTWELMVTPDLIEYCRRRGISTPQT